MGLSELTRVGMAFQRNASGRVRLVTDRSESRRIQALHFLCLGQITTVKGNGPRGLYPGASLSV